MEVNLDLLPWRLTLYKLDRRKFFVAFIAFMLTIFSGISFYKIFNYELIKWQQKYQHDQNYLLVDSDSLSLQHKKITEFLNILNYVPKNLYLQQIIFAADNITIVGVSENYNNILTLLQIFKNTTYLANTKLISAEQIKNNFNFKININITND